MSTAHVRAACPHDCPDTCAIRVTVQDGVAVKVQGDPDHPPTHGALCTKVSRYPERTYHPDRVLTPLRRTGPKGSGRFEPVGWDEALADIAGRLKAIAARDPQAVLPYSYAGTMGLLQGEAMAGRFFHKLGASLLDRTICSSAGGEALASTYGAKVGMHVEFFAESRLILVWGSNPITSSVHFWTLAQAAKRRGAKLVCIDPRRSETAEKCHQHIALLPGTDGALALGLMHELVVNGWLDADYIERHVDAGWPQLRARALQWPPERAAATCGITAEEVRGLARDYATLAPAAIRLNYGMQRVRGGGNAARLIAILPCLVGAWRHRAGGLLLSASGWFRGVRNDAVLQRTDLLPTPRPRTINMSTIGDDLLRPASSEFGPQIEAIVVYNSNPVAVAPESAKVAAGFRRDDLFTVVLEHFLTDTADHADFVLPATTQLEHLDVHTSYGHTYAMRSSPAIAPLGQAKPNTQIFRELAAHMGWTDPCFADDDESLARIAFGDAVDPETLVRDGWFKLPIADAPFANGGFPTPNGRCIVDSPRHGVPDHVPNHESAASTPALAARYPLAMISPPARHFLNSSFVNVASLRAAEGEPVLEIHADDAGPRRIDDGRPVRVWNDRGATVCKAVVTARARPGVVNGLGIWWRKFGADGTNVNELTHQRLTDLGQAPSFYDCLVEVAPLAPRADVKRARGRRLGLAALAAVAAALASGCSTLGYYAQSIHGHLAIVAAARPVDDVIADPATPEPLRRRLVLGRQMRDFAVSELKEPDNASYRRYADLGRKAAVWNVVAAPELSLALHTWCYPIVGCVGYRGYYDRGAAERFAAGMAGEGLEIGVYGVPAYSTLGKLPGALFADPLLNTFIDGPEGDLARLMFHELAHQIAFAPGDTVFNESFATTVETLGGERWLAAHADAATREADATARARRADFEALTQRYRGQLDALYRSDAPEVTKRAAKAGTMAALRTDYAALKSERWSNYAGYDGWFDRANNASFAVLSAYTQLVPNFRRLFEHEGGDFARFYAEVRRLAALPFEERRAALP